MEETRWGVRRMEVPFKEGQGRERAVTNNIHEWMVGLYVRSDFFLLTLTTLQDEKMKMSCGEQFYRRSVVL
jgi:hypothetical protein